MSAEFIAFVILNIALFGTLAFLIIRQLQRLTKPDEEAERQQLKGLINEIFGEVTQKVGEQSREILKSEQKIIETDLKSKQEPLKVITERHNSSSAARNSGTSRPTQAVLSFNAYSGHQASQRTANQHGKAQQSAQQ